MCKLCCSCFLEPSACSSTGFFACCTNLFVPSFAHIPLKILASIIAELDASHNHFLSMSTWVTHRLQLAFPLFFWCAWSPDHVEHIFVGSRCLKSLHIYVPLNCLTHVLHIRSSLPRNQAHSPNLHPCNIALHCEYVLFLLIVSHATCALPLLTACFGSMRPFACYKQQRCSWHTAALAAHAFVAINENPSVRQIGMALFSWENTKRFPWANRAAF